MNLSENLRVTYKNGVYIVGTNETKHKNGYIDPNIAGPTLTIPAIIHKHEIDQIGRNAFSQCPNIEEVFISDSIRVINTAAFSECPNLRSVLIPSSIEFIGNLGIHGYNVTLDNINPNLSTKSYTGKGMMKVIFQPIWY